MHLLEGVLYREQTPQPGRRYGGCHSVYKTIFERTAECGFLSRKIHPGIAGFLCHNFHGTLIDNLGLQGNKMPEICRFYGIIIRMFLIDREHPPRHIHIKYGEHEAVMELMNLNLVDGSLPKKCQQLVREWAGLHQEELIEMWDTQKFHTISPLE